MWPSRQETLRRLDAKLLDYSENVSELPGVATPEARTTLAMQMVASLRRLDYTKCLLARPVDPARADPSSPLFDPERAAILHFRAGNLDEAIWLLFLSIHFGKHSRHGWTRLRDFYSRLGKGLWTWEAVCQDLAGVRAWLTAEQGQIGGAFGNHRKYESLSGESESGTGAVIASYVAWVGPDLSHKKRFAELIREGGNAPESIFDHFYQTFEVKRFGRLGRFDFLALIGRLGFAPISPGSAYLHSVGGYATGPLRGARLLFGGDPEATLSAATLDRELIRLDESLGIGMQVMEDSLCNWQKSPSRFVHFKG